MMSGLSFSHLVCFDPSHIVSSWLQAILFVISARITYCVYQPSVPRLITFCSLNVAAVVWALHTYCLAAGVAKSWPVMLGQELQALCETICCSLSFSLLYLGFSLLHRSGPPQHSPGCSLATNSGQSTNCVH